MNLLILADVDGSVIQKGPEKVSEGSFEKDAARRKQKIQSSDPKPYLSLVNHNSKA